VNRTRFYPSDLLTGIVANLAARGVRSFSIHGVTFDRAFHAAYLELKRAAEEQGSEVAFRVRLHPIHGDSETAQEALYGALSGRILTTDSPPSGLARIAISAEEAPIYGGRLPGGLAFYAPMTDAFSEDQGRA
jgi:hypothetical protein